MSQAKKERKPNASAAASTVSRYAPLPLKRELTHTETKASEPEPIEMPPADEEARKRSFWVESCLEENVPYARKGTEEYEAVIKRFKEKCMKWEKANLPCKSREEILAMTPEERGKYMWRLACVTYGSSPHCGTQEYDDVLKIFIPLMQSHDPHAIRASSSDSNTAMHS